MAFYSARVNRAGEECAYIVEKTLYTLVLERRTADHRVELQSGIAEGTADFVLCDSRGVIEIFCHEVIVEFGDFLKHLVAPFLGLGLEIGRNLFNRVVGAHALVVPEDGFHENQVDNTLE